MLTQRFLQSTTALVMTLALLPVTTFAGGPDDPEPYQRIKTLWHCNTGNSREAALELLKQRADQGEHQAKQLYLKRLDQHLVKHPHYRSGQSAVMTEAKQVTDTDVEKSLTQLYQDLQQATDLSTAAALEQLKAQYHYTSLLQRLNTPKTESAIDIDDEINTLKFNAAANNEPLFHIRYFQHYTVKIDADELTELAMEVTQAAKENKAAKDMISLKKLAARITRRLGEQVPDHLDETKKYSHKVAHYTKAIKCHDIVSAYYLAEIYADATHPESYKPGKVNDLYAKAGPHYALAAHQIAVYMEKGNATLKFKINPQQALLWHTKAATQGHPLSQYRLAQWYLTGEGVPQDEALAARLLLQAATAGVQTAQLQLVEFYRTGKGVPQDEAQAFYWLEKTALQGNTSAYRKVARAYETGRNVRQNFQQAVVWYLKAIKVSEGKDNSVRVRLGRLYETGQTDQSPAAALKTAVDYYQQAADQGYPQGAYHTGRCFFYGLSVNQDYAQAFAYFTQAVQQPKLQAPTAFYLGVLWQFNLLSSTQAVTNTQRLAQAKTYYTQALASAEHQPLAAYQLGWLYQRGWGVAQDVNQAITLWQQAGNAGHLPGFYQAGRSQYQQLKDQPVSSSALMAIKQLLAPAARYPQAQYLQGLIAELAVKVTGKIANPETVVESQSYFLAAAAQHHPGALFKVGQALVARGETAAARTYLLAAAQRQHVDALLFLSTLQEAIPAESQDLDQAVGWTQQAEHAFTHRQILKHYKTQAQQGNKIALQQIVRHAQSGNAYAQYQLGKFYEIGQVVPQDITQAITFYGQAAAQYWDGALLRLEDLAMLGIPTATQWFTAQQQPLLMKQHH